MSDYRDDDWPVAPDPDKPKPGIYEVAYLRSRIVERFKRRVIEIDFEIIESGQWAKKIVKLYFSIPLTGSPSEVSKYYLAWCKASGGTPKRGDRMTPHVFAGYWRAKLGLSERVTTAGGGIRKLEKEKGEVGRIRIDHLIERVAGSAPRASSRRGKALPPDELR